MTKKRSRNDNAKQLSLLDYLAERQAKTQEKCRAGSLNVQFEIKEAVSRMLKVCPLSRFEVASRMSELTGVDISKFMLDSWSAESKEYHRFPAEFIPALCTITESNEILDLIAEKREVFILPGCDALRAEVQHLEERIRELQTARKKRLIFLKEIGA